MKPKLLYLSFILLFSLFFTDCAKKGTPSGGARDTIPPVIVRSVPENYSTNFSETEFKIYFDEYIKLNELQKNLIISPPLKYTPVITPLSTSKVLRVKILDTLKENTTYSFNFGKSIVDNNEANEFEYYKYIFSTGSYIDSLKLSGTIRDAEFNQPDGVTTVALYEANETFNDSLVLQEKPTYITTTPAGSNSFEFSNLKEGTYQLVALKDINNDYIFQPTNERIGFLSDVVTIPTDTSYTLTLSKEKTGYQINTPKQTSKNELIFGYQGNTDSLELELLSKVPSDYRSTLYKDVDKDTLHYWFKPAIENDSLIFLAKNKEASDSLVVKMRDLYRDSLVIQAINQTGLTLPDTLKLRANIPMTAINTERLKIIDKDSVTVKASAGINLKNNTVAIIFPKEEEQTYEIKAFPGFITDFFEGTNDTLSYRIRTKATSDYGTLSLQLENVDTFPVIVQLVSEKFAVVKESVLTSENSQVYFDFINPAKYLLRVVFDTNKNSTWDPGNFLSRQAPERIVYYPTILEVKSNWSLNETFILSQNNPDPVETEDDPEE
ncbi:Ig-like domain-containing protein [Jejudonia soesokkakensis]|uniref:Ig-like domain-containing protein n=1 Tax=Jejudonia soesokkakensis TaxID=1323432 RepID=A0ABW2MR40_9FLAO